MDDTKRFVIAYKGLKPGQYTFHFEVDGGLFAAYENSEIKDGHCRVEVVMTRLEQLLDLDIAIAGSVVVACDRCLEDCEIPIDYRGHLAVKFSDEGQEYDGEVLWLSPSEDEVDLTQYIYESIVLALPYQRVHPEGKCNPEMMARFRIVSGEEFAALEAEAEQQAPPEGEWAKLASLKERMEREELEAQKEALAEELTSEAEECEEALADGDEEKKL